MSTAIASASTTSPLVQVSGDVLTVAGHRVPLDEVLQVETYHAESRLRNGFFFLTACLGPIAAMIIFTAVEAPAARWGLGLLGAAGPFIAILASFAWKKPWGVLIEGPTRYRCVYQSPDRAAADAVTEAIRGSLAHQGR